MGASTKEATMLVSVLATTRNHSAPRRSFPRAGADAAASVVGRKRVGVMRQSSLRVVSVELSASTLPACRLHADPVDALV